MGDGGPAIVSVALLTIYDMCKALDRRMEIREIHLERGEGGKSGTFIAAADSLIS